MTLLLTCSQVTDRLTDYLEGATSLTLRWRMRTHLSLCPGCRAFLRSLRRLPNLVGIALALGSETPPEAAAALEGALARIRPGGGLAPPDSEFTGPADP